MTSFAPTAARKSNQLTGNNLMTKPANYRDHKITISIHHDEGMGEPWKEHDGHGVVSEWVRRDKKPGELVLNESRGSFRYYDFAETLKIARRDGWGCGVHPGGETCKCGVQHRTERECIACAVRQDFEHLRAWCNDEWHWQGYTTKIETPGGVVIEGDSCWGFDDEEYMLSEAMDCARATVDDLILTAEQTQIAECCP